MKSLTPAQRSRNLEHVKGLVTRLARMPTGKLLSLLGAAALPVEGIAMHEGGQAALLQGSGFEL